MTRKLMMLGLLTLALAAPGVRAHAATRVATGRAEAAKRRRRRAGSKGAFIVLPSRDGRGMIARRRTFGGGRLRGAVDCRMLLHASARDAREDG